MLANIVLFILINEREAVVPDVVYLDYKAVSVTTVTGFLAVILSSFSEVVNGRLDQIIKAQHSLTTKDAVP